MWVPRCGVGSGWVERIVISVGCKSASKVISRREQHILNLICYKSNAIYANIITFSSNEIIRGSKRISVIIY